MPVAVDLPTRVPHPEQFPADDLPDQESWELTEDDIKLLERMAEGLRAKPRQEDEPTTLALWDPAAGEAMHRALVQVLKHQKHRSVEQRGQPRTARIIGYGMAGPEGARNDHNAAWLVNDVAGTMTLSTSILSPIAAEAAVQAFDRSVNKATRRGVRPKRKLRDALRHDIPAVIDRTRALYDRSIPEPGVPETLGVHIVGNQLFYGGEHTLVVHHVDTDTYTWLTPSTRDGAGRHTLGPGSHVVLMHTDPRHTVGADVISAHIKEGLSRRLAVPADMSPEDWAEREPAARSQQLAEHVRQRFIRGGAHTSTRVLASIVEVAGDTSGSSLRHLSNLNPVRMVEWINAATRIQLSDLSSRNRALQSALNGRGRAGRLGSFGLALASLPGAVIASRLAPGLAHDLSIVALALTEGTDATAMDATTGATTTGIAAAAYGLAHHAAIPDVPAPPAEHAAPEFHDGEYTATSHDAGNGGHASNITNMAQQSLAYYGKQAGLSDAQIRDLEHNQTVLDGAIDAFAGDKADPDNGRVVAYPQMWVLNQTDYSLHDMNTFDQHAVAEYAQQHGASVAPPAAPVTPTDPTTPANPATPGAGNPPVITPSASPSPAETPSPGASAGVIPHTVDPTVLPSPTAGPAAANTSDAGGLSAATHDAANALRAIRHNKIMMGSVIGAVAAVAAVGLLWPRRPRPKKRRPARAPVSGGTGDTDTGALRVTAQVGSPIATATATLPSAPAATPDPQQTAVTLPVTPVQDPATTQVAVPDPATVATPDGMQDYQTSPEPGHLIRSHRFTRAARQAGRTPPVVPKSRRRWGSARIGRPSSGGSDGHVG